MGHRPRLASGGDRRRDDAGGVWIVTGMVLGVIGLRRHRADGMAGFTAVAPLVVIPPVLAGDDRRPATCWAAGEPTGRSPGRPAGPGRAPLSSGGPNGPLRSDR